MHIRNNRTLLSTTLCLATLALTACGGSGSSNEAPALTQETQEMAAVLLAVNSFDSSLGIIDMGEGLGGAMSAPMSIPSDNDMSRIKASETEACDSGSRSTVTTGSEVSYSFNNCRGNFGEMAHVANGSLTTTSEFTSTGTETSTTANNFSIRLSRGSDYMQSGMHGSFSSRYTAWNDYAGRMDMEQTADIRCDGKSSSYRFNYANYEFDAEPSGPSLGMMSINGDVSVNISGAPAGMNGQYTYTTLERMQFAQFADRPSAGRVHIEGPGVNILVEFAAGGLYINGGSFLTWEQIEEKVDSELEEDLFLECESLFSGL